MLRRGDDSAIHADDRASRVALCLLIVIVSIAHVWWIGRDVAPIPHPNDPYHYLTKLLVFLDELRADAPIDLWSALGELSKGGRPPLYQLLSLPFVAIGGRSFEAALLVNVALGAITLVCVYAVGQIVAGGRAGFVAAVVMAAYPPAVQLTRIYRPHGGVAVFTALSILFLLLLLRDRSPRWAWGLGASLAAGLLFHPTLIYSVAAPVLLFGGYAVFFQTPPHEPSRLRDAGGWLQAKLRDPLFVRGLLPAALLGLGCVLSWYLTHGSALVELQSTVSRREPARAGFVEVEADFAWYLLTAPGALSNALMILALAGVVWCLMRRRLLYGVLAFAALAGYAGQNFAGARSWWYFSALLPITAAASGVFIAELRPLALSRSGALVTTLIAAFVFSTVTWGVGRASRPLALALGAPLDSDTCASLRETAFCPAPAQVEVWPTARALRTVLEDAPACARGQRSCRVFLALHGDHHALRDEWRPIKPAHFEYLLARDWPAATAEFARFDEKCQVGAAVLSEYILAFHSRSTRNDCLGIWERFIANPPRSFRKVYETLATFPLPGARSATLWKRIPGVDLNPKPIRRAWAKALSDVAMPGDAGANPR